MRVLVIRPQASAEKTASRLVMRGHQPLLLPVTEARHDPVAATHALSISAAALAVTSAEAIRAMQASGALSGKALSLPLFAVGKATADVASEAGFRRVIAGPGNGADLARLILASDIDWQDAPLVYVAGEPRAAEFEDVLDKGNLFFRVVTTYAMRPVAGTDERFRSLTREGMPEAALFHSRESAKAFFALPSVAASLPQLSKTRFCCLAAAIVSAIPEALKGQARIAERPEEASLLDCLGDPA